MKKRLLFFCVFVLFLGGSAAQFQIPDLKEVHVIPTHVAVNVDMLEGTGDVAGNIGVSAGPDGSVSIGKQFAQLAGRP